MKEILTIVFLFLLVQALGLFVGITIINGAQAYPEFESLNVAPAGAGSAESSLSFMLYVLLGAVVILLAFRFYKGVMLYRLIEAAIIFFASNIVFYVVLLALNVAAYGELSIALSALLMIAKFVYPKAKNVAAVIASAGVGAIFGFSLDPLPALVFMAGLSIYDILAVFWTKHMITMAKELSSRNLAFSVSVQGVERVKMAPQKMYAKKGAAVKAEPRYVNRRTSLELGTGDMAIPLMLAVSSYKTGSIVAPIAIALACAAALYVVLWYVMSRRTFLPALPPLCGAGALALGIVLALGL
jgi:presenilin-like A22 family membrane protease